MQVFPVWDIPENSSEKWVLPILSNDSSNDRQVFSCFEGSWVQGSPLLVLVVGVAVLS